MRLAVSIGEYESQEHMYYVYNSIVHYSTTNRDLVSYAGLHHRHYLQRKPVHWLQQ
jgi:hypothetical protein